MPDFGVQKSLGPVKIDTLNVNVQEEVLTKLRESVSNLEQVIQELTKTQQALSYILGESVDTDEEV